MTRDELIGDLNLTGSAYDAHVLVRLPNGEAALIHDVVLSHGEVIIVTTLDAREEGPPNDTASDRNRGAGCSESDDSPAVLRRSPVRVPVPGEGTGATAPRVVAGVAPGDVPLRGTVALMNRRLVTAAATAVGHGVLFAVGWFAMDAVTMWRETRRVVREAEATAATAAGAAPQAPQAPAREADG